MTLALRHLALLGALLGASACRAPTESVGLPALISLAPDVLQVGTGPHTIVLDGDRFTRSSQVRVNGQDVRTTFVDARTLRVELPVSFTNVPSLLSFVVLNSPEAVSAEQLLPVELQPLTGWTWLNASLPHTAWDVSLAPSGQILVGGFGIGRLSRLNSQTGTVSSTTTTSNWPYDVVIDSARGVAFVAGLDAFEIDVIDLATFQRTQQFAVGRRPIRAALSADRTRIFTTTVEGEALYAFDATTGVVQGTALPIGGIGNGLALTPDGQRLWVTTTNGLIHVVVPGTLAIERSITMGGTPQDVVLSPSGDRAYVANEDGWIGVYATASGARVDSLPAPAPFSLALQPGTNRLWASSARSGLVAVFDVVTQQLRGVRTLGGAPRTITFDRVGRVIIANEASVVHIATPTP